MRFDPERYLYAPLVEAVDIGPMNDNYEYVVTQGRAGSQ